MTGTIHGRFNRALLFFISSETVTDAIPDQLNMKGCNCGRQIDWWLQPRAARVRPHLQLHALHYIALHYIIA